MTLYKGVKHILCMTLTAREPSECSQVHKCWAEPDDIGSA